MIAQKSIQDVIEAAKIEEVVGDFVNLRRRGVNMIGLCPFHNEKTPSFNVSPAKNIFKCFGCSRGGTPVQFVMELENLSFPDAIRYLAKKYRIELEETQATPEAILEQQALESLYLINQFALEFFQEQLLHTDLGKSVGLSYFKRRGFREETIRKFGLGFAPDGRDAFTQAAISKGYAIDQLRKLGLTSAHDRDFFRNRVIFPIHSQSGKVIAFAGRILHNDPKAPKYINSPETDIYQKSKVLYGAFQAKTAIRKEDSCILVEGYTDVISLHQNGIENAVASSGTSLTIGQIRLIKRFTKHLTILYDGDAAGIRAALRGLDLALEEDMEVRVVILPDGEDPDSYVQKVGAPAFREYVKAESRDIIQLEARLLMEEAGNDPSRRATAIRQIAHTISRIKNPIRLDEYVRNVREILKVDEAALMHEINQIRRKDVEKHSEADNAPKTDTLAPEKPPGPAPDSPLPVVGDAYQERDIARILITAGEKVFEEIEHVVTVAEYILMNIEDVLEEFDHPLYQRIARESLQLVTEKKTVNAQVFFQHPDPEIRQLAINLSTSPYDMSENWALKWDVFLSQPHPEENHRKDAENLIKRFKLRKIKRFKDRNTLKLKSLYADNAPEEAILECLALQLRLKDIESQLAKDLGTVIL
ncbi:MAG: DNA primase [Saprospiraceae bacterium]